MKNITTLAHADGRIGSFSVVGRVTPADAGSVLIENDRWTAAHGLHAQVVSYRAAEVAIEPELLCSSAKRVIVAGDGGLLLPTALLVHPDHLTMWRNYCWMMAQAGVVRAAFTDPLMARTWAEDSAALWVAQEAYRRRVIARR